MTAKRRRPAPAQLITPVAGVPWAIDPAVLKMFAAIARVSASIDSADLRAGFGWGGGTNPNSQAPVRVLPVYGPITNHSSFWSEYFGGCSVDRLRADLRSAIDDATVKAVVLAVNSPGGEVMGMTEFAAEIRAQRGGAKPIVAMIDTYAHSAAYWLAAQADEVVMTTSGTVGSIGIYTVYEEISGALKDAGITETVIASSPEKGETLGFAPLTDDALQAIRDVIMGHAAMFTADVAKGRNVSVDTVNKAFSGGRVFMAKQAIEVGMVDRVDTLANTLARLAKGTRPTATRAEGDGPELVAGGEPPVPEEAAAPFTERIGRLVADAVEITTHARERARLRDKEGRAPVSSKNRDALRSIQGQIGELLKLGEENTQAETDPAVEPPNTDPEASAPAVEPPAVVAPTPALAARAPRFSTREEWLEHLQEVN